MLESDDGLIWRRRAVFQEIAGDETAFLFDRRGAVLGIGRRRGTAQVLRSNPPYTKWERRDLDRHIGGPLLTKWGGRTVVGGRRATDRGPKTSMCWLVGNELHEFAELPSAGDNSYPGFVALTPTRALMSWYSSHEGSSSIYLADLEIPTDESAFTAAQAASIRRADTLLSYQRSNGGFSKGRDYDAGLDRASVLRNAFDRVREDTTLDNGATHSELRELAAAYTSTRLPRFRHGCLAGIEFLLESQYANGGWPQRYPKVRGYSGHITFNDGAVVGALSVLRDVASGREPFAWTDEAFRRRANDAVKRGVECILKCQVIVDGTRTVWGQQHDAETFAPQSARAFEPASLCSAESVGVVEFLMSLEDPSPEVVGAVEAAVAWLDGPAKLRRSTQDSAQMQRIFGGKEALFVWSRLYEIGTNRPVFGDRDGKTYYNLGEISEERQNGYAWYVLTPRQLLETSYPAWRAKR